MQWQKSRKAFRGHKGSWPELENVLEDWVNTQRAGGRGVSTVQIRLKAKIIACKMNIEDFKPGPSWCFRFLRQKTWQLRHRPLSVANSLLTISEKLKIAANSFKHKRNEGKYRLFCLGSIPFKSAKLLLCLKALFEKNLFRYIHVQFQYKIVVYMQ